ncbi:MAG TPA: hypothetical protein VMZ53_29455 [Kofleriaceae bacterium]|nr:hypothetical protein [Kofleriaceae bacterium]
MTRSGPHPLGTPNGLSPNTGPLASAAWLVARGLSPSGPKWFVEMELDAAGNSERAPAAKLLLEVYAEEWGYRFERDGRISWIRVTDVPFVHGRDEHGLLPKTPRLASIGELMRELEAAHAITFERHRPTIRSNVPDGEKAIPLWIASL